MSRRQYIAKYKMERGCLVCGFKGHPDALQLDHLPGVTKVDKLADMCNLKWSTVLKEIAKCQVLCANCHAIETASRRRLAMEIKKKQAAESQLKLRFA